MPSPDKASIAQMIIIGLWGTYWHYEYFCDVKNYKETENALEELKNLTYHNKDPVIRPLIDVLDNGAKFADKIGKIIGKYS